MKENYIKTEHYEMWIEEGIVHIIYARDLNICLEIATAMVFNRFQICKGRDLPLIVKLNQLGMVDNDARAYLAHEDRGIKYISRLAIITQSISDKLIAEIWKTSNKPIIPTRIFEKPCNAVKWLQRYQLKISA